MQLPMNMKLFSLRFPDPGPLWVEPHQRAGGRGDVGGGDGLDRCQGRQGWRRGEQIFFLLQFESVLKQLVYFRWVEVNAY